MWRAWVESVIARQTTGWAPTMYRALATIPSYCFAAAVKGRHLLYDQQWLPSYQAQVPVISIGNLVCGGAGKTQCTMLLAKHLMRQGKRIGILSRGYGGHVKKPQKVIPGQTPVEVVGDEPLLMAKRLPDACVVVGKDRVEASALAIEAGAEVLILDDGMQYRRLQRDLEIVVVDGRDPVASREFLPKGCLRELPERLQQADLVVCVGALPSQIHAWTQAPCIEVKIMHDGVFDADDQKMMPPRRVGVFCGIGKPLRFVQTVEQMGSEVVAKLFLQDHAKATQKSLDKLARQAHAAGAEALLCTEKDWVKGPWKSSLPIGWVRTSMHVVTGNDILESIVERKRSL